MSDSIIGASQSSLLRQSTLFGSRYRITQTRAVSLHHQSLNNTSCNGGFRVSFGNKQRLRDFRGICIVSSDSKYSTAITDSAKDATEGGDVNLDTGGGGDGFKNNGGSSGGGGDHGRNEGEGGSSDESKKNKGFSMSQKLTLAFALLVGVGGTMGYMKSGSHKSLLSGGLSAGLLFFVCTQLPTHPVFASSVGLGVSAALLAVMGSRFRSSGKIFPAGVVSLVSLVMTAGYLHGIMRSAH